MAWGTLGHALTIAKRIPATCCGLIAGGPKILMHLKGPFLWRR